MKTARGFPVGREHRGTARALSGGRYPCSDTTHRPDDRYKRCRATHPHTDERDLCNPTAKRAHDVPAEPSAYDVRRVGRHLDQTEEGMVFHAALVQMFARRSRGRLESVSVLVVLQKISSSLTVGRARLLLIKIMLIRAGRRRHRCRRVLRLRGYRGETNDNRRRLRDSERGRGGYGSCYQEEAKVAIRGPFAESSIFPVSCQK